MRLEDIVNEMQKRQKKEQHNMDGRENGGKGKEPDLKVEQVPKEVSEVKSKDTEGAESLR